jgi:hypothetical protein
MSAPLVRLDFATPRSRVRPMGLVILLLGCVAATAAVLEYQAMEARRAGLELKLAQYTRQTRDAHSGPRAAHLNEEATRVATELGTPWTKLLAELEVASRDTDGKVAVLSIEPDHEKHRVHISGESGTLALTLAYVSRLQATQSLRYPMLDSHEIKQDDPQHPVRFALTADWTEAP